VCGVMLLVVLVHVLRRRLSEGSGCCLATWKAALVAAGVGQLDDAG
jgi:hypothetical protein